MRRARTRRAATGFTLIELLVVVMIIGILAAVALPQYFKVIEKSRASEAVAFLGEVNSSEERYLAQFGTYVSDSGPNPNNLDITTPNFKYFSNGWSVGASGTTGWTANVGRNATPSSPYGTYTVIANCGGGAAGQSCTSTLSCSGGTCTPGALGLQ